MERVGLAWDVVKVTPERARAKLAEPAGRPSQPERRLPAAAARYRCARGDSQRRQTTRGAASRRSSRACAASRTSTRFFVSLATRRRADRRRLRRARAARRGGLRRRRRRRCSARARSTTASTWRPRARRWMRRLDHSMIFVLIAGTYTPFALLALHGHARDGDPDRRLGRRARRRRSSSCVWIDAPEVGVRGRLRRARLGRGGRRSAQLPAAIGWLGVAGLAAGGAALHASAPSSTRASGPNPWPTVFGYHEVFHALVIAAAALHYAVIAFAVLPRG